MRVRYAIRNDVAWVDAVDGGRAQRVAWIADLATGEAITLRDAGWLAWTLLAEGFATAAEIQREASRSGVDFGSAETGLDTLLERLVARGLVTRVDAEEEAS